MSETAPMSDLSAAQVVADLRAQFAAEPDAWLIRKGGYYYRPNCQGYTTVKAAAGRYSEAKAKSEAAVEPGNMSAIRADDVPGAAFEISREQAAALLDHIAHQAARLEELELKWIEAVGLGAQAQAALTAAEAEKERLARERDEAREYAQDVAWQNGKLSEAATEVLKHRVGDLSERTGYLRDCDASREALEALDYHVSRATLSEKDQGG